MPDFKIGDYIINASSVEVARKIHEAVKDKKSKRLLILENEGNITIVDLDKSSDTRVYSLFNNKIDDCGVVRTSLGDKVLQSAIGSLNIQKSEISKLSHMTRTNNIKVRHNLEQKDIDEFEKSIPSICRGLYEEVMKKIDATTIGYKLEIINELFQVKINSENWVPILTWFRDKVIKGNESKPIQERTDFFTLRKAFVTTVIRMAKNDARHLNTMKLIKSDGKSDIDWEEYAKNKK